jgi:hypothetical protein
MNLNILTSDHSTMSVPIGQNPIEANNNLIRQIINKTDNPHPLLLTVIVLVIMVIIYLIYVSFLKPNFSGEWYNSYRVINVKHNKYTDEIYIDGVRVGTAVGNALYIKAATCDIMYGIYTGKKIYWVGSDEVWMRPITLI